MSTRTAKRREPIATALTTFNSELSEVRAEIAALLPKRTEIETAPCSVDEALELLDVTIMEAQRHRPDISQFLSPPGCRMPTLADLGLVQRPGTVTSPDGLAWLLADAIRDRLATEIERKAAEGSTGLSAAERAKKLAAIDAGILALERREEALIVEAEAAGIVIDRRGDADPRAVLEIDDE